jgi:peroxiredoxin
MKSTIACSLLGAPLVAALVATAAMALEAPTPGRPAPDFTATDSSGKPVTLSGLKGKTVVLEWTNHDCPYVRKHYGTGTMQKLQADATRQGVVWLTVVSSAPGTQGHVKGLEADKLTADRKASPTSVLLDEQGTVGRLYGATTTPHMFIVDAKGTLVYRGGIDDQPSTNPETIKGARPFVREALDALAKGEPVKTASTRPYGCSVKYTN